MAVWRRRSVDPAPRNRSRRVKYMATALCLAAFQGLWPAPARADESEIQRLENEIQQLQAEHEREIKTLQAEIEQVKAQEQKLEPPPNAPRLIESPTHQFGLSSANGENSIAILARLQIDTADYFSDKPEGGTRVGAGPGSLATPQLDSGINARRARLGIGGTIMSDWAYRLIYDLGGSADSVTTGVSGAVTSGVENAYVTFNGFNHPSYPIPFAIDFGYLDVPWSLDEATSSNDIMFLERSSSQVVATEFGGGDFRSALGLRSNSDRYWAGFYLTGPNSGAPHNGANNAQFAALGRVSYQVVQTDDASLHIGINALHLFQPRAPYNGSATGPATNTPFLILNDRPELRVDPTTILNTGGIPAKDGTVGGLELAGTYRSFYFQGEYFHYLVDQLAGGLNPSDGTANLVSPTLNFNGGYLEGSYSIGGRRRYIPETGAYSGVIPDKPFTLAGDGWGALEFAARYSVVDLNDHITPGMAPHLTGGVYGGNQNTFAFDLAWYPNRNLRFILEYLHANVDKLKPDTTGTASTTRGGATVDAIAARTQLVF